ncbi:arginine--tRNA ligase [Candidatus Woesearchaeota archaeon]|nr:arginine--tRNA ligase [Candidatus Woesearchaeota archaeon]
MNPKKEVINLLKKELKLKDVNLSTPPDPKLGDYAFPCFVLAKELKKNPVEIAKELSEKIKPAGLIKKTEQAGPFLNFFIDKQKIASKLIPLILKGDYGKGKNNKKIMVEFISPNTNKSLHLGHIRNGLLGEALSRVLEYNGYKVVRTCLNNDRGVGVSEAMLGYKKFYPGKEPDVKPDHFAAKCYVDFKKAESENPRLKDDVQKLLVDWEEGKPETMRLWKKLMKWVYKGYKETYKNLGIKFDKEYHESEMYKKGKEIIMDGFKKGIFVKEDGAVVAKLEDYKLPDRILIKSDGTALYLTQDIYLAKLKFDDFKIDQSIYVVASEQDNHFKQLFKILEMLGFKFAEKCHHLSYGLISLPSGRMKSREGKVVDADDLIDEMIKISKQEIKKRHKILNEKKIDKRARVIGLGALKFYMLKFDNTTAFTYDPEKSLSFEGETGPYIQYVNARIASIFKKTGKFSGNFDAGLLNTPYEEKLINLLSNFPSVVSESAESYKPYLVARYLIDLCQAFNAFYLYCPIAKADEALKQSRLGLVSAVKEIVVIGLDLLGIEAPEEM